MSWEFKNRIDALNEGFRRAGRLDLQRHTLCDLFNHPEIKKSSLILKDAFGVVLNDQLILEYCNYTANPWIHVSFSIEKNRTQVLTFFNHKKHSDGLSNLA